MSALTGHPKGLYLIFATSTAERFSYYGMRAIFILFLTQALLFDKEAAASIYGSYTGLVYLTPLIGGYIADKYWGIRRSVFWGAVMMAVGQFLMFMSASTLNDTELAHWLMYGGLGLMVNKLSPLRFASLMMGIWYLSTATANKFAGMLSGLYPEAGKVKSIFGYQIASMYDFFMVFVIMSGVASLILFLLSKKLQKMMHGVE